jgi:sugar phosphate isomerase/epimerase
MHSPWEEELQLWQEFGWKAAEIWYAKMQPLLDKGTTLESLACQMKDAGVEPIGMCAGMVWTSPHRSNEKEEYSQIAHLLDATAAMDARALTVVVIGDKPADLVQEHSYLVDKLRRMAEMAAERKVLINLEFLGGLPVNGTLGSGIELVNRVDHPSFGLLFDYCHYYTSASHLEELALLPVGKLFAVHVDDAQIKPMEVLTNEERCFPGEGRIDVGGLTNHLLRSGYRKYFTVELYDKDIWEMDPRDVLAKLNQSLRKLEEKIEA